jgi:hypothetical protein
LERNLQDYYRRYKWTGIGLLQALRMNCHRLTTGARNEVAEGYYRS